MPVRSGLGRLGLILSLALTAFPDVVAQDYVFPTSSVCGNVFDEAGRPAPFVKVTAAYMGGHSGPYPAATTDVSGHYCLLRVPAGPNFITADDTAMGYPNLSAAIYAPSLPLPITTVPPDGSTVSADIHIPYKAATLHIRLVNAENGQVVPSMTYRLSLKDDDRNYLQGNGPSTEPVLIPPHRNIYLSVRTGALFATALDQYQLSLDRLGSPQDVQPMLLPRKGDDPPRLLLNLIDGGYYTLAVSLRRPPEP